MSEHFADVGASWPTWLQLTGLPVRRPFTRRDAREAGVDDRCLAELVESGHLAHLLRGVYHARALPDSLELRVACLTLVVPDDAVVTDRSAAWLHGATMALAPNDHLVVPRVSVYRKPGFRLRNTLASSGERGFSLGDIVEIGELRVTSPVRTMCDLGRLLSRDQALAALDALARATAVSSSEVMVEAQRFRGYRGVRQLRELAPLIDPRSQSQGESILRLRWLDCSDLPRPEPQLEFDGPHGPVFLDLGLKCPRYAAEYDGTEWHGEDRRAHDKERRSWVRRELGYVVDVFLAADIHGPRQDAPRRLRSGLARAAGQ